jgi:hypothetical protein
MLASSQADIESMDLVAEPGKWHLAYAACATLQPCPSQYRVWYTSSTDVIQWQTPRIVATASAVTVGIVPERNGVDVVWGAVDHSHDWRIYVSRQPAD